MPLFRVEGPQAPLVTQRSDQDIITIGRSSRSDVLIPDPSVSRAHAEIRRERGHWVLRDLGSRNGTLLNGIRVRGPRRLKAGDLLRLGETTVIFDAPVHAEWPAEDSRLTRPLDAGSGEGSFPEGPALIGRSRAFVELLRTVDRVAAADVSVLITGESGTGKELIARRIHHRSARAGGPFVVVNCPALPGTLLEAELFGVERGVATGVEPRPGHFEMARGGTILLDEIGDLEASAQAKILRAIEERCILRIGGRETIPVDVRILAATHHDLEADLERGTFRRDLYHRLNTVVVHLPPLRDRREDIPLLVEHFLSRAPGPQCRMSDAAMDLLVRYDYPGNVRELLHAVERAGILTGSQEIRPENLPPAIRGRPAGTAGESEESAAEALYRRIVDDGESFWDIVHGPYLRRQIARGVVERLLLRSRAAAGGGWVGVTRAFRIRKEYRRFVNFLNHHGLCAEATPRRGGAGSGGRSGRPSRRG